MQLVRVDTRYILRCTYDQKEVAKAAGFKWSPSERMWWTDKIHNAIKVMHFAEPTLKQELHSIARQEEDMKAWSAELSSAKTSGAKIPAPEGLDYVPFQKAGIQYGLAHKNVLIADEPGLGKTIQAIGIYNADKSIKRVLIICPAVVTSNWVDEWGKWAVRKASVTVTGQEFPFTSEVVVISYDRVKKHINAIHAIKWDMLVCDESHMLKNSKSDRSLYILGGVRKKTKTKNEERRRAIDARRVIFLTGTPLMNKPADLWTTVHRLDPQGLGEKFMDFHLRYCNAKQAKFGWDFSGASNLSELNKKLRENFMVRRLKSEVLTELPPKTRQILTIDAGGNMTAINNQLRIYHQRKGEIDRLKRIAQDAADEEAYRTAVKQLRITQAAMFEEMSKERHKIAVAKIPHIIDHLGDVLTPEHKVVFFAHHRDVIDAVAREFHGMCVVVTGSTSPEDRGHAVRTFQEDPFCLLFIANIIAGGVGITLTASSHVVCGEFDWRPSIMTQAEDRCHRIGQKDNVFVQHLVFEGSLDALMAKVLVKKQETIDAALDGKELPETEDHVG